MLNTNHPLVAAFAAGPIFVSQDSAPLVQSYLTELVKHADFSKITQGESASANDDGFWFAADDWRARYRPYNIVNGILQIPVKGVLLHNFPYTFYDWATGYEYILRAFQRGCEDFKAGNIKGIAFVCDSPGGHVAGCFDAVDKMSTLKAECGVPVAGFAHESAYSACYAVITVADPGKIWVSKTGGVGSIGVVTGHLDVSGAMEKGGLKYTFIFAGKHKVDGNPYEPLSEDVKARIQARIDELYEVFVSTVARNRGLEEQAVRDTEALCFTATQAVSNKLADKIGSLDDAVSAFAGELSSTSGEEVMSVPQDTAAEQTAAIESALAAANAKAATDQAAAVAAAVAADRERQKAITGCEEAKGRAALANHIALNTEMSVEDAKAMLAAAPTEAAPTANGKSPFETAMEQTPNPEAGAQAGNGDEAKDDADEMFALVSGFGLRGTKPAGSKA